MLIAKAAGKLDFRTIMSIHKFTAELHIPAPLGAVWDFFSAPANLATLTPGYMNMRVTSGDLPNAIRAGQIITYKVSLLLGVPVNWMTEITHVEARCHFVDDQRRGPFRLWHHQHLFEPDGDATRMTDIVHYEMPFWVFGEIAHQLFVRRQIANIFEYRRHQIGQLFPG